MIFTREITAAVDAGRRRFDFMQHAVDAVTHLQPVLERLDMDVRGALLDRALDHQVDQPDDRRFGGQVAQMLDVVFARAALPSRFSTMVPIAERPLP